MKGPSVNLLDESCAEFYIRKMNPLLPYLATGLKL